MKLFEELKWRGLIKDISSPDLEEKLNNGGMTFYIGTDPTGDSMHIGHFSSFLISKRLKDAGHHPILLVGGGTGLIGDPRPTAERPIITQEEVNHNFDCLKKQAEDIFGFEVVNNYDWIKNINAIEFLRDYGKYFSVNYMLDKDIVRRRLDTGITYAEFSYMILQALDFLHLHTNMGVNLQVAGQDQWGNITAGIELIRKRKKTECYGFTLPLITKADGTKFGKSEGNAIWLDRNKTSVYELYQFLINVEDSMVVDYLKLLTFLSVDEINKIESNHKMEPDKRNAHKALAREVITFLHGSDAYLEAVGISDSLFRGNVEELSLDGLEDAFKAVDSYIIDKDINIIDLLVDASICSSKREAREFVTNGSITLNGDKILELDFIIDKSVLLYHKYVIIRRGKKKYHMITYK